MCLLIAPAPYGRSALAPDTLLHRTVRTVDQRLRSIRTGHCRGRNVRLQAGEVYDAAGHRHRVLAYRGILASTTSPARVASAAASLTFFWFANAGASAL